MEAQISQRDSTALMDGKPEGQLNIVHIKPNCDVDHTFLMYTSRESTLETSNAS